MAKMSFKLPEEMLNKMENLADKSDTVLKNVLERGAQPLYVTAKEKLSSSIGKDTKMPSKAKGELMRSLRIPRPFIDSNGNYGIKVGCEGNDSEGTSNAMKAAVLEHGKSDQVARPWLKPSGSKSKNACIEEMKKALEDEIQSL